MKKKSTSLKFFYFLKLLQQENLTKHKCVRQNSKYWIVSNLKDGPAPFDLVLSQT